MKKQFSSASAVTQDKHIQLRLSLKSAGSILTAWTIKARTLSPLAHLDQLTEKADVLVLPLMKADGLDISSSRNVKVSCSDVSTHLKKNALVAGGLLRRDQIEYFSSLGFDVKDYYKREELVIRNCIPTAEGALQIAMQELAVTVNGSTVLVIGYGRVKPALSFFGLSAQM